MLTSRDLEKISHLISASETRINTKFDKLTNNFDMLTNNFDELTNNFDKLSNNIESVEGRLNEKIDNLSDHVVEYVNAITIDHGKRITKLEENDGYYS